MNTGKKINKEIIQLTMEIREKHPELIQFLDEMQITLPGNDDKPIDEKALGKYRDSLKSMLQKYESSTPDSLESN